MLENSSYIDLSHTIDEDIVTWDGPSGFNYKIVLDYKDGACVMQYHMEGGIGTHMDAPSHFFADNKNIGDIAIEQMIAPLCIIDVTDTIDANGFIIANDVYNYEKKYGEIQRNSVVVGYTGWEKWWPNHERYRNIDDKGKMHFPGFDITAASLLLERGVAGIGIDTLSIDGSNNEFLVHKKMLGSNKYLIENLCNLKKMPPSGSYIIALPIKINIATEAPIRAVGVVPY
jgi:kynurenine formamidase